MLLIYLERVLGNSVVLGWREDIYTASASSWANNFYSKLASGYTVGNAINYANSQTYPEPSIKNIGFFGDWNRVIANSSRQAISTMEQTENNIIYPKSTIYFEKENINSILNNIIKDIDSEFNLENYEINIYRLTNDREYYTIDLVEKIGDYYTNSGYTVIVENGIITQIANNKIEYNEEIRLNINQTSLTQEKFSKANELATNKVTINNYAENTRNINLNNLNQNIEVKEQKNRLYIDLNTNKKYIQVLTTYSIQGEESKKGESYLYEI